MLSCISTDVSCTAVAGSVVVVAEDDDDDVEDRIGWDRLGSVLSSRYPIPLDANQNAVPILRSM
jgi:hypothetical protein